MSQKNNRNQSIFTTSDSNRLGLLVTSEQLADIYTHLQELSVQYYDRPRYVLVKNFELDVRAINSRTSSETEIWMDYETLEEFQHCVSGISYELDTQIREVLAENSTK
jgi:hypothetical protein